MHKEAVEKKTLELIKSLQKDEALKDFFLVGGTALALHIGHRKSIDIDFFSRFSFNTEALTTILEKKYGFGLDAQEKNTLLGSINGIKLDIITHEYKLLNPVVEEEGIRIASKEDIAAMKINAISNDGTRVKDFIDIYFLLKEKEVAQLISCFKNKYELKNPVHAMKSLNYFDQVDLSDWPELLKEKKLKWPTVKKMISGKILQYVNEGRNN